MKKQIVFIHGGEAFSNHDAFLERLRTCDIKDPLTESPRRWKDTLRTDFADAEVYLPQMPNKQNAKYEEWKIWFERHFEYLHDGVVLIGHSQGGLFLAKYLSENTLPVSIKATYLISAPAETGDLEGEDGGDFWFDKGRLKDISGKVKDMFIIHSKDDSVVPFSHAEVYQELLPDAKLIAFEDRGHFLEESFHELVEHVSGQLEV